MDQTVRLADIGKRYVKYEDVPLLLSRARFMAKHRRSRFWALRHIDLEVDAGESIGIIGRNGSGKSTMLRMLAGVTAPTEGTIAVRGRLAPLISVGVGFHRELTGRENIYVNGTILGLTRKEIDRRLDSIMQFAEIDEFIDTPVKFYSSGMFVRLGFSVAVASDPEVLLVDEVLAVGDLTFQLRCYDRMEEIRRSGATILVVSHNLNAIRRICTRTVVLDAGKSVFTGDTDEAISVYQEILGGVEDDDANGEEARGGAGVQIESFTLTDAEGKPTAHVRSGEEITFTLDVVFTRTAENATFGLLIHRRQVLVYMDNNLASRKSFEAGQRVRCAIRVNAALATATYSAEVRVGANPTRREGTTTSKPITFFVSGRQTVKGVADLGGSFAVDALEGAPSAGREQFDPL